MYSGPQDVFAAQRETLQALSGADYRGADPGLAMLYFQLSQDLIWATALGYLHALALGRANGISAEDFQPYATATLSELGQLFAFYTPRIDAGEHPGDVDRLAMGVASAEHVLRTSEDAGVDAALPATVLELFRRGVAEGHADDSVTSLVEVFSRARPRRPRARAPGRGTAGVGRIVG